MCFSFVRRTGTFFYHFTNRLCVYFTVVMVNFSHLQYWATEATQMSTIITEETGFCSQLSLQLWNEISQYSQKIH